MQLADTLDLTRDLETRLVPRAPRRSSDLYRGERPFEEDLLLAPVPTVRGFKVLGGTALYGRLGRGGTGAVYRGRHLDLGIDVAVKCLLPGRLESRPGTVSRFEREVALTNGLDHPNVVQVLGSGNLGGLRYLVMEYVHGETLRRRVRRLGALPWEEALAITRRAARGLGAAHQLSLVHRDVKPDNLMVGRSGEVKVCDLGLVKGAGTADGPTAAMSVLGTPRYMAPEQWGGASEVGPAADVYGLGACLYYMLVGEDAMEAKDLAELRRMATEEPFPDVREAAPGVPEALARIVDRCVARDPRDRYANGDEMADALGTIEVGDLCCLLDGGEETVPLEHRACGPAHREERALRRALALRSGVISCLGRKLTGGALIQVGALALAWALGWACAR